MDTGTAPTGVVNPTAGGYGDMPTVYTQPEVATTGTVQDPYEIFNCGFVKGLDGVLKIIEITLSLVTFICSVIDYSPFTQEGGGWVQFVAITAFMLTGVLFLVHLFKMTPKLTDKIPFKFTEFSFYAVYTLFYFIAGIVAACVGSLGGAVVATAVFAFFSLVAYGCDACFHFLEWRQSSEGPYFSSMMTSFSSSSPPT
jgi:hypothetical protein